MDGTPEVGVKEVARDVGGGVFGVAAVGVACVVDEDVDATKGGEGGGDGVVDGGGGGGVEGEGEDLRGGGEVGEGGRVAGCCDEAVTFGGDDGCEGAAYAGRAAGYYTGGG